MGIQKTKPVVGQANPEEELRQLEEAANARYGKYQEALNVTKELQEDGEKVKEEIKALTKQLEAEQGNLSQYTERQAAASAKKVGLESELASAQQTLASEEQARQQL